MRAYLDAAIDRRDTVYLSPELFAAFYADIGEVDLAFEWLEIGYRERDWGMARLKTSRMLSGLRSDPRFDDLLRRIGFPLENASASAKDRPPVICPACQHENAAEANLCLQCLEPTHLRRQ